MESKDVRRTICDFFSGEVSYIALVDPNHVYKSVRYYIVDGSSVRTIVYWVLESSILRDAGVIK